MNHLKTSGIMSGSGLISYTGGQYINESVHIGVWKIIAMLVFMTIIGVVNKLVLDRLAIKK